MNSIRAVTVNRCLSPPTCVPLSPCLCVEDFLPHKEHVHSAQTDRCSSSDQIQDINHPVEKKPMDNKTERTLFVNSDLNNQKCCSLHHGQLSKEEIQRCISVFCFFIDHPVIICHQNINLS
nr:hypothetical protein BgiMline_012830 [Biomphalaria glabrata]